ncbi:hypothetical protein PanWU01x14_289850 [Parasponia andersonii]|uniref:Uncharacterized protein n=1 Tax=Parasponia andersonii TaxID=3476 RepID=A0A2P5AXZ3_PARAD|nr:hypothetical protein PanWU01x14_289850 [Parasponia andersonii]
MNFDVQPLVGGQRQRTITHAGGVKNRGQMLRRWPKNHAGGRIFAGLLGLRLSSKRDKTGGVGFIF